MTTLRDLGDYTKKAIIQIISGYFFSFFANIFLQVYSRWSKPDSLGNLSWAFPLFFQRANTSVWNFVSFVKTRGVSDIILFLLGAMCFRASLADCPKLYHLFQNHWFFWGFLRGASFNTFPNLLPLRSGLPFLYTINAYKTYTMLYAG